MTKKTVVELDLVGYSDTSRLLEENLGAALVAQFNDQIQEFVDFGLKAVKAKRNKVVMATPGDGAILVFEEPTHAHHFAVAVHKATQAHNADRKVASAKRWFRIGGATGELHNRPRAGGGQEIAGMVIATAVRLEAAARPGQFLIDDPTFNSLGKDLQVLYGPKETVSGKRKEKFAARRYTIVPLTDTEAVPTILSALELFDRLNPRDQMETLMICLRMPQEHRPPDTLDVAHRRNKILDWAQGHGDEGLSKVAEVLNDLIRKQQSPLK
jgi:class 3 adenylate cyclase